LVTIQRNGGGFSLIPFIMILLYFFSASTSSPLISFPFMLTFWFSRGKLKQSACKQEVLNDESQSPYWT
jgi:hypothetical protein